MSYTKIGFVSGQRLTADNMNHIEDGIAAAHDSSQNANGLSDTASALLINILRNGLYSSDQSANITALEQALASSGDSGSGGDGSGDDSGGTETVTYVITNKLTNVTSNNSTTSVTEGASYTATLTVADGYDMDSVTVTMGGVDVTADVYADGVISIPAVTGNVVITAAAKEISVSGDTLITDGLLDYFDFRNAQEVTVGTTVGIKATQGSGAVYAWGPVVKSSDEYGVETDTRGMSYSKDGNTTATSLGTQFTVFVKSYGGVPTFNMGGSNTIYAQHKPKYINSSGSAVVAATNDIATTVANKYSYNSVCHVIDGNMLTMYIDGVKYMEYNGEDYTDFSKWYDIPALGNVYNSGKVVGAVVYNRALSDVEVVETNEFFKTMEVA